MEGDPGVWSAAEHLKWCRTRMQDYLDADALGAAMASFISDLGKHPETARLAFTPPTGSAGLSAADGLALVIAHDKAGMEVWADDFVRSALR